MCSGGYVTGPDGSDTIHVWLHPGEHVYGPDGKLLFAVGGPVLPDDEPGTGSDAQDGAPSSTP
jgi:hypothetical protein